MTPEERIVRIATAIADGTPVDWSLASDGTPASADVLRELRVIAEIAGSHRTQPDGARGSTTVPGRPDLSAAVAWGPLLILERVGEGSYGHVYRAWDPALDHEVALKRLRLPAQAPSALASSVVREGQLLARVRHQNVITVHGACEVDGEVGIWMDFVRGRTLEQIVQEQGPMSAQEACIVGDSVCRALAAVHLAGLLHRDVKASNVMREAGGRIVLVDFGVSHDFGGQSAAGPRLAGTPLYVAPELFLGESATVASDVYSVGVLLFHLVTGTYPVTGKTMDEVRDAHASGNRVLLSDVRPDLPRSFVRVVERALSPGRTERYASAGALLRDLTEAEPSSNAASSGGAESLPRREAPSGAFGGWTRPKYSVVALMIAALATAGWWLMPLVKAPGGSIATANLSIAVLPFVNERGEPDVNGLGQGIAEGVIRALEQVASVHVLSSASSRSYSSSNVREVGTRLGVGAVVTGRFSAVEDGMLAVTPELIDTADGHRFWTGDQARVALGDLPTLANTIALRVASKLPVTLSQSDEQRLGRAMHVESSALSKYLQGRRAAEGFTPPALRKAIDLFREAKAEDPQFADADKGIAYCYLTYMGWMFSPREAMPNARIAAENALKATDGADAEATAYLGVIAYAYDWNWAEAERHFVKSISGVNPPAYVHQSYASYLIAVGRTQDGLQENKRAVDRQPYDPDIRTFSGWLSYLARKNDEALPDLKQTIAIHDPYWIAHLILARVYEQQRLWPAANAELRDAIEQSGGDVRSGPDIKPGIIAEPYAELARWYALTGRRTEALNIVKQLEKERAGQAEPRFPYIQPTMIAAVYAALGDADHAFQLLRDAAQERDLYVTWINADPAFDVLRSDARFGALLASVNWPGKAH